MYSKMMCMNAATKKQKEIFQLAQNRPILAFYVSK